MRHVLIAGTFAAASVTGGPAVAESGRYVMEPTENGYVRMDTETGEMSVCQIEGEDVVCRLGPDERSAFLDALDALESRVAVLERRLNADSSAAIAREGLPDPEEFERGLGYMEEFMRRFMGIVEEFEDRQNRT